MTREHLSNWPLLLKTLNLGIELNNIKTRLNLSKEKFIKGHSLDGLKAAQVNLNIRNIRLFLDAFCSHDLHFQHISRRAYIDISGRLMDVIQESSAQTS